MKTLIQLLLGLPGAVLAVISIIEKLRRSSN